MSILISLIGRKFKLYLAAAVAVILVIGAAFVKGRQTAVRDAKLKSLTDYRETRERMDETNTTTTPADAREWLRNRRKQ